MTAYGIDFGTTNSALAVINNGEIEIARIDNPPVEWDRLATTRFSFRFRVRR